MAGSLNRYLEGSSGIVTTLALGALSLVLSSCDGGGDMSADIGIDHVIASSSSGFFMEGCSAKIYHLSDAAAQQISEKGLPFFATIASPRDENPRNPYGRWTQTPVPGASPEYGVSGKTLFAMRALGGCGDNPGSAFRTREIEKALRSPGSYYALTRNREGMMLVMPQERLAAFFYAG